jgi:hypothetical protein
VTIRLILALLMVVVGATIVVRMMMVGFELQVLPGVALGGAMIALGIHRTSLILRMRGHT